MAYRQYRCLTSHFSGFKYYKEGLVYLFTSDPGSRFELAPSDSHHSAANLAQLDRDGTLRYKGVFGYDDFRFPMSSFQRGATNLPEYDYTDMGLAFPQNDTSQVAYASHLTPHRMMLEPGVRWHPHVHFFQDEPEIPVFEYRYRFTGAAEQVPAWSSWIASTGLEFEYVSGKSHQILVFPWFDAYAAGAVGVAALVDVQLRRNDNVVAGTVIVKEFDFHAPFDAPLGSGQEFLK